MRPPARMTNTEALQSAGPEFVYYSMRLRGASNLKAREAFYFRPRRLEWLGAAKQPSVPHFQERGFDGAPKKPMPGLFCVRPKGFITPVVVRPFGEVHVTSWGAAVAVGSCMVAGLFTSAGL